MARKMAHSVPQQCRGAPRPYLENLIVLEIIKNKQTNAHTFWMCLHLLTTCQMLFNVV
jgi:hypothetical protein